MFDKFESFLSKQGFIATDDSIIVTTIVEVPKEKKTNRSNPEKHPPSFMILQF
ncbi:hypothetical protein KJ966_05250 [bacterium]|nr:hypothetical protein [bacterium]